MYLDHGKEQGGTLYPYMQSLLPDGVGKSTADATVHHPQEAFMKVTNGHWEVKDDEVQWGRKIGEGANAVIYKCKVRGVTCVGKRLKNGVHANSQSYKDLIMELDILTTVALQPHTNLVRFIGASISDPANPIIFEEYVNGPTLDNFLTARFGNRLGHKTLFSWSLDILKALDYLHNRNPIILHRDLKPANLMLTRDLTTVKLADFGMCKPVERAVRDVVKHHGHTGTLRYMAPEVLSQRLGNYNEKADIYSASLVLWYMATGLRPPDNNLQKIYERPDLQAIKWPNLERLVERMWAQDPNMRPSARECIDTMNAFPDKPDISHGITPDRVTCCTHQ
mmetsp:Transcript_18065/g.40995  ORF Transcript_18065/g.40995 Transcript_18065/m.40995 type:complete len:337 (-) Transcript_18065:127-1137(-)